MNDLTHSELKEYGNRYFENGQYQKSIMFYSNAIKKQPNISIYFTNRALCYLKISDFDNCINDCRRALDIEPMNIKAYFYMGQAFLEQGNYDEALIRLLRAHDMSLEQHKNYGDDITTSIRLAKRLRFEKMEFRINEQDQEFQNFLENLIRQNFDHSNHRPKSSSQITPTIKEGDCEETQNEALNTNEDDGHQTIVNDEKEVNTLHSSDEQCQYRLSQLYDLFQKVQDRRSRTEVPDYLCGRISFEIMRDPVISPSGITYDRTAIVEHLHKVGHFDPITRQLLTEDMLICNVSMKEVINTFLENNPWADHY